LTFYLPHAMVPRHTFPHWRTEAGTDNPLEDGLADLYAQCVFVDAAP